MAAAEPGAQSLAAFAGVVRDLYPALPARQRAAGWARLQQSLAAGGTPADRAPQAWSPGRLVPVGLALASVAIVLATAPRLLHRPASLPLAYAVTGDVAPGEGGGVLAARNGPVQLVFTDGSHVDMQPAARLSVAARDAAGSDIRLVDGTIDVDVRHRPGASWTFQAGPYTVRVKGTAFRLGWQARDSRLTLRMKSGLVTVSQPGGAGPRSVAAGESLSLGEAAPLIEPPPPAESPAVEPPASRRTPRAAPAHREWPALLAHGDFASIVRQAASSGIDACLSTEPEANLAALADAARYTHHAELTRRALLSLRSRFPAGERARDAAFFLGRLGETANPAGTDALVWYQRYLREAGAGPYAEEALGRQMILFRRAGQDARARAVAGRYLAQFPRGIYAGAATDLSRPAISPP